MRVLKSLAATWSEARLSVRLIVWLNLIDVALTLWIVGTLPAHELNPLGVAGGLTLKALGVGLALFALPRLVAMAEGDRLVERVADVAMWFVVAYYAGLAIWNLANLAFIFFGN